MSDTPIGFKVMLISLMIIFGSLYTLSFQFQNSQYIEISSKREFYHPFMQTTIMFACQSVALVVYIFLKRVDLYGFEFRYRLGLQQGKIVQYSRFVMLVPAVADMTVSCLRYVALNIVPGSVFQMMRGGSIVTTFLFSRWLLGMRVQKYQLFGFGLAVTGLVLVGIASMVFSGPEQDKSEILFGQSREIVGYFMLIASLIIEGFYYTYEEKLFRKYHIEPLKMVGFEGIFGLGLSLLLVIGLSFVNCKDGTTCMFSQSPIDFFNEIRQNFMILVFFTLGVLAVSGFNIVGVTITKHLSGLARTICHLSSTIIVWVVGLIMTLTYDPNKQPPNEANYDWQTTSGGGIALQVVGLALLLLGNLYYNHVLIWKKLEKANLQTTVLDQSLINNPTESQSSEEPNQIQAS